MIKEINDPKIWNDFLLKLNPNTFLQSWEWGQVQKADGEDVRYLGIFKNDKQIGACLLLTINARRGRHFLIPHGPVFPTEEQARKCLPEIIEFIRNTPEVARSSPIALRISPLLESNSENVQTFRRLGFHSAPMHVHAELTWLLDINKSKEEILSGMRKTTRHAIKKAQQAGVELEIIRDSSAIDRFYPLYEQTRDRHDFVPYSKANITRQLELMNFYAVLARHQNQDIAAGIFFQFGNTIFYYHGASNSRVSGAGQLLQWASIQEAQRRGAARYNFWGISDQPKHPFSGITVFKKGFGGYPVNHIHAQDLPLSLGYWKLWVADTYRKFKRGF